MSLFGSIEYGPYVCKKCGAKGGCNHEWIQDTETIFECKDCGKFGLYRGVDDNFRDELIDKRFTLPWNKLRHELKLWHDKDEKYEYNITHG